MSDDEAAEDEAGTDAADELSEESLRERVDAAREALEAAETEADLDDVEADLAALREDLEAADLPDPDDEEEEGPRAELADALDDLESDLEDARGPYAEDVAAAVESTIETITGTEWTPAGVEDVAAAVEAFVADVEAAIDADVAVAADDVDASEPSVDGSALTELTGTLETAAAAVTDAGLDPDDDAETIATLLEATDDLSDAVEDAEEWSDLTVRDQLLAHGYYDVLDHRKDFPPELGALKVHEKNHDAEMILLGLEKFDSDFMEEACLNALKRTGPEEAIEPMLQRAGRRDTDAIAILGKIGSDEPVDTLLEYVDADGDPKLQKATFRALGEIGTEDAVQPLADKLVAENATIRSNAARALGLIGDTRAIAPLSDVLEDDDDDSVRASAAWALVQIGTEDALESVAGYTDDRNYLVQVEAEKATSV